MSGLVSATIVVVATSTADYNVTTMLGWDAEATAVVQITPGLDAIGIDTGLSDMPTGGLWLKAHINELAGLPAVEDIEKLNRRALPGLSLVMSTPVLVGGRPMSPKYPGSSDSSATLRTDPGHLTIVNDPDPVWNSSTSSWVYPPPSAGVGDMRWTVNSMPLPSGFADGDYLVGASSRSDGTTGQPSATLKWAADSSTPAAPQWNSAYPYKPTMVQYVHHNSDGSTFTMPRGLQFNRHYAQHMWMDIGATHNLPFTWIIVALVQDIATTTLTRHYILDSGKSPFTYLSSPTEDNVSQDYDIPGTDEGLGYRTHMSADRSYQYMTNKSGTNIHTRHPGAPKPRMYFGVYDYSKALVGNWTHGSKNTFQGKLPGLTSGSLHRYYVLGRANGHIGIRYGSNMVVFEMRFWTRRLTMSELNAQYAQLAATWKFSQYK